MGGLSFVSLVKSGGFLMVPIAVCSIIAIAVVLERYFALRRARIDIGRFMESLKYILDKGDIDEAVALCRETGGPIARILLAGIMKHSMSKEDIREAIDDAGRLEVPRLERYLGILGTVANVSPLLGLLGTVFGMIKTFFTIQLKAGAATATDLAGGIAEALVTTAAGLSVAIPTLIFYNYFISLVDNMIFDMEVSSAELVDLLMESRRKRGI